MEVFGAFDRPAFRSAYAVAGRLVFIESFDPRLAPLIEQLFAGWQLTPISFSERTPDVRITFGRGEPDVPPGLSQFEVAEGGRCYTAGDHYYLKFDNSLLHLRQGTPVSVDLWIKRLPVAGDVELARVTSFAVCAALRRFGLFELHGAGVVAPGKEEGVLIVGPSGSGKSTLTLNLAGAGWGYLSDDEVLLALVDERVEAQGFRSFFAVPATVGSKLKNVFEPKDVFSSPPVPSTVPRSVFFISISGEEATELRALSQPETMTRLLRGCPWATYDTAIAVANLDLLSRLARQVKGFDLSAGADLLEPAIASRIIGAASA